MGIAGSKMQFVTRNERVAPDALFNELMQVSPIDSTDCLADYIRTIDKHVPLAHATVWKINYVADKAILLARQARGNIENEEREYIHPYTSSLVGYVTADMRASGRPYWTTDDIKSDPGFDQHRARDRVIRNGLMQVYSVAIIDHFSREAAHRIGGVLQFYTAERVVLPNNVLTFISASLSSLYSTLFLLKRDKVSEAALQQLATGSSVASPLDNLLNSVCLPLLHAESASIVEWDEYTHSYRIGATTGLSHETRHARRQGLNDEIGRRGAPVILSNISDESSSSRELGFPASREMLFAQIEATRAPATSFIALPVRNPALIGTGKVSAIIRLMNKRHVHNGYMDYFDHRDLTIAEEVSRALALYEEQARLKRGQQAFSLLFGHEAQAPAAGIRGTAERILYRMDRGTLPERLQRALVQDIRDFSELAMAFAESLSFGFESGLSEPGQRRATGSRLRPVNLREPGEAAKRLVIPQCRFEGLEFASISFRGTYPIITTDPRVVMQIFYNLFVNSIKYRDRSDPDSFRIEVTCSSADVPAVLPERIAALASVPKKPMCVVTVSDWGIGIEEADREEVFEPGYRSPAATKLEVRGSGLGLAIVKNIMRSLGGAVWVRSARHPTAIALAFPLS